MVLRGSILNSIGQVYAPCSAPPLGFRSSYDREPTEGFQENMIGVIKS
jgi:hypothetical protein